MKEHQQEVNAWGLISWTVIAAVLCISYVIEAVKGVRTPAYTAVFCMSVLIPLGVSYLCYRRKKDDPGFFAIINIGYMVMYTFAMLTGNTPLVFTYILPPLCFMVLMHRPKLVLGTGIYAFVLNMYSIAARYAAGEISVENSRDIQIQIALLILCFWGAWIASRLYGRITRANEEAMDRLKQQTSEILRQRETIQSLETGILQNEGALRVDQLTGLGNRTAGDRMLNVLRLRGEPCGYIFCDANGLKYLNDTNGHGAGDAMLKKIASLLESFFRRSDCYRISGDEFLVIAVDLKEEVFMERAQALYRKAQTQDPPLIAIGWAFGKDPNETIRIAEKAMYEDKDRFYAKHPGLSR